MHFHVRFSMVKRISLPSTSSLMSSGHWLRLQTRGAGAEVEVVVGWTEINGARNICDYETDTVLDQTHLGQFRIAVCTKKCSAPSNA